MTVADNIHLGYPNQKTVDWLRRPSYVVEIKSDPADGGECIGSGTYKQYANVTIKAIAKSGYEFVKWSDGVKDDVRSIYAVSDVTLTAEFQEVSTKRTITVLANDDSLGTITGSGTYDIGEVITITATPKAGAKFVKWNDGNKYRIRDIVVYENITYTAYFDSIYGTITYNARL